MQRFILSKITEILFRVEQNRNVLDTFELGSMFTLKKFVIFQCVVESCTMLQNVFKKVMQEAIYQEVKSTKNVTLTLVINIRYLHHAPQDTLR